MEYQWGTICSMNATIIERKYSFSRFFAPRILLRVRCNFPPLKLLLVVAIVAIDSIDIYLSLWRKLSIYCPLITSLNRHNFFRSRNSAEREEICTHSTALDYSATMSSATQTFWGMCHQCTAWQTLAIIVAIIRLPPAMIFVSSSGAYT